MAAVDNLQHRTSRLPRSPSHPRSAVSKRSPSPIISLSSENPKGVKNITRKVIKRLEGLGHLEMIDTDSSFPEEDEMDLRTENIMAFEPVKQASPDKQHINGNGAVHVDKAKHSKTEFEIPRKLLHSSIGASKLFLHWQPSLTSELSRFCYPLPLRFRNKRRLCRKIPLARPLSYPTSRPSSHSVPTIRADLRAFPRFPHARERKGIFRWYASIILIIGTTI